jgi:transposase-like protein
LSKDAVSRLVGRLAGDFETWRCRDLADDHIQYLIMDGWYPKVRIGKRRERVPVLVTLGVRGDGGASTTTPSGRTARSTEPRRTNLP